MYVIYEWNLYFSYTFASELVHFILMMLYIIMNDYILLFIKYI